MTSFLIQSQKTMNFDGTCLNFTNGLSLARLKNAINNCFGSFALNLGHTGLGCLLEHIFDSGFDNHNFDPFFDPTTFFTSATVLTFLAHWKCLAWNKMKKWRAKAKNKFNKINNPSASLKKIFRGKSL